MRVVKGLRNNGESCVSVIEKHFYPHPPFPRGQALTFPHRGFTGVGNENNRACGRDFTPIPRLHGAGSNTRLRGHRLFPLDGGRDFGSVIIAALGIYIPLSAYRGGRDLRKFLEYCDFPGASHQRIGMNAKTPPTVLTVGRRQSYPSSISLSLPRCSSECSASAARRLSDRRPCRRRI